MKKIFACLCLLTLTMSSQALSLELPDTRLAYMAKRIVRKPKINRAERWEMLAKSLSDLAQSIVTHNKFAYETKFTRAERAVDDEGPAGLTDSFEEGFADELYNRVWAKDKTLVIGYEAINDEGQNYAYYINTADPELFFAGNIHVGADISVLEKFFGASINSLTKKKGEVVLLPDSDWGECVRILYRYNRITELEWYFADSTRPSVERVAQVVSEKKSEIGLSSWDELKSRY